MSIFPPSALTLSVTLLFLSSMLHICAAHISIISLNNHEGLLVEDDLYCDDV